MGADAYVYLFNYRRYRDEVVPGLVELLRGDSPAPWLQQLLQSGWETWIDLVPYMQAHPTDVVRYCTYLGTDLRYPGTEGARGWLDEAFRPCRSSTCRERGHCPMHQTGGREVIDSLNELVEAAVVVRCLGPSQFVGRSMAPHDYLPVLAEMDVPSDDPLRDLLTALALRGSTLGYMFSNSDGIHGWLTVEETAAIAGYLDRLPLPRYEPTFDGMAAQRGRCLSYPADGFDRLSLSFVRTTATVAATLDQAILWGNDLSIGTWHDLVTRQGGTSDPL